MKNFIIIKTTFNKIDQARNLAKILIEKKLAACVQISKIETFYSWEEKTVNEDEFLLTIKTKAGFYKKVEKEIINNHEYQIPQIFRVKIDAGFPKYLDWIAKNLEKTKKIAKKRKK